MASGLLRLTKTIYEGTLITHNCEPCSRMRSELPDLGLKTEFVSPKLRFWFAMRMQVVSSVQVHLVVKLGSIVEE